MEFKGSFDEVLIEFCSAKSQYLLHIFDDPSGSQCSVPRFRVCAFRIGFKEIEFGC